MRKERQSFAITVNKKILIQEKTRIQETIRDRQKEIKGVRIRIISRDSWSNLIEYNEDSAKFIFNTQLVDGLKIELKYVTLFFNARH